MSNDTALEEARDELAACQTLAALFLDLPTEEGVGALLGLPDPDADAEGSYELLARFARDNRNRAVAAVLEDIARDRVLLVRGMGEGAIKPPYESLYSGGSQGEAVAALNRFYGESGFRKQKEARDAADQIGVEFAFAASLLERRISQLDSGDSRGAFETGELLDRFLAEHLGRWAPRYADAVIETASTDYWRGVGLMIKEYLDGRSAF